MEKQRSSQISKFMINKPILQKILKEILHTEEEESKT
jgi:hypothetical protein